ncbi:MULTISPECIES: M60 family metallopeptidase [Chitinophagaceae]
MLLRSYLMLCIFSGAVLASCKKYGYSFPDGYDNVGADSASISVDTTDSSPDYSMYAQATIFPGVVADSEARVKDYNVDINLDYIKNPDQMRISVLPLSRISTGLYAPTGEPIKVVVPAGVYSLVAQIGAWTDNLTSIAATSPESMKREPIVYTVKKLVPGVNYIRSPFGGPIYINSEFSLGKTVTLQFSGAVVMPDFILGKTDETQWRTAIAKSSVPWFELRAPHIIFTMNTEKAKRLGIQKLEELMQTWEDIFNKDYSQWEGLSDNPSNPLDQAAGLPWRCVGDIQPSVGYAHSGAPVVFQDDDHWFKAITSVDVIKTSGSWGILHEVGHNNQQGNWMWSGMGETTNNLFSYKVCNRFGFLARPESFTSSSIWDFVADSKTDKNFMTDSRMDDPYRKMTPFVQIFELYGYDFMTALYTNTRHALRLSNNDQDKVDFVYQTASDYTGNNMLKFFNKWGLYPSAQAVAEITAKGYPKLATTVWLYNPVTKKGNDPDIAPYAGSTPVYSSTSVYAQLSNTAAYNIAATTEMTIQFKMKITALANNTYNPGILKKTASSANSNQGWWFVHNNNTGAVRFVLKGASGSNYTLVSNVANIGEWHTYTGKVYYASDGKRYMKLYMDGFSKGDSLTVTGLDCSTSTAMDIGQRGSYVSGTTSEMITDIQIFNSALPDAVIAQYACVPGITSSHPNYSSLTGYWPCAEGSGSTLSDKSSSGNNFTFTGSPTWSAFSDASNNVCVP